jgi:hypothetical protein
VGNFKTATILQIAVSKMFEICSVLGFDEVIMAFELLYTIMYLRWNYVEGKYKVVNRRIGEDGGNCRLGLKTLSRPRPVLECQANLAKREPR